MATERLPVLVVDDDASLTRTIEDILHLRGFEPRCVPDGGGALEAARDMPSPLAIALVDLRLPDMDGLELAHELRTLSRNTQVVILTGNATVESAIRALRDEECDYLVKPVDPDLLVRTLHGAAQRWRLKQTEDELQQMQQLLHAMFDASPLPIIVLSPQLTVRLWNRAAEHIFGWSADEVIGMRIPIVAPEDELEFTQITRRILNGDSITGIDVRRRRRDGTSLDIRLSAAPLYDTEGRVGALLGVYEDITERRRIEEHLRQAQKMEAVGRLAGGVAHDFNNLLAVILTSTSLAMEEPSLDPEIRELLADAHGTAQRGAALTRQLLAFARRQPVERRRFNANELVDELQRMLRRLIGDRHRLDTALAADLWPVEVDRGQLEQVVTNLVVNARDAMGDGGTVTIRTWNTTVAPAEATSATPAGDWVVLAVDDTGTGIPDELLERIFEPFFTTKGRDAGTGLGLATCYGIVQRFGGTIAVQTTVGTGSSFRVYLPRASAPDAVASGSTPAVPAGGGSETILVVEDQDVLRATTRRLLTRLGYTVHVAASGEEAMRVAEQLPSVPHLLFTDGHLPDCHGEELIARFQRRWPEMRAMLVSGSHDLRSMAVPRLEKPYTMDALARTVRTVLDEPPTRPTR
ncbi:MAG TPA: response regulator [Gemmatimonadaceae bacterium]|nr:response regulator [Gemmatimonadaceae bacterium]